MLCFAYHWPRYTASPPLPDPQPVPAAPLAPCAADGCAALHVAHGLTSCSNQIDLPGTVPVIKSVRAVTLFSPLWLPVLLILIKTSTRCPQRSGHLPSAHTSLQVTGKDLVHPACKPLSWCPEQCKYGTEQKVQVPLGPPLPASSVSSAGVCLALRVDYFMTWEFTASCDLAVCD